MSDFLVKQLDAALAIRDDDAFLEALGNLDPRYAQIDFTTQPAPLCWFASLCHLHSTTDGQGIERFLSLDNELDFALTLDSARRLGATRTVAWLEATAALYPRKTVPVADTKRHALIERLYYKARDAGTPNAFETIDMRFADALPSLASDVRRWVVEHGAELEEMLRRVPAPAPAPQAPPESEPLADLHTRVVAAIAETREVRDRALDPLREAATAAGMLPWRNRGVDPRAANFYVAASQFAKRDWLIVARRVLAAPRKFRAAESQVSSLLQNLQRSDLVPSDPFKEMLQANWAVRNPVVDLARSMPVQVRSEGKSIGLLSAANDSIIAVSLCLAIHDWVTLTADGIAAARLLYGLFDGIAPCPELPPPATQRSSTKKPT